MSDPTPRDQTRPDSGGRSVMHDSLTAGQVGPLLDAFANRRIVLRIETDPHLVAGVPIREMVDHVLQATSATTGNPYRVEISAEMIRTNRMVVVTALPPNSVQTTAYHATLRGALGTLADALDVPIPRDHGIDDSVRPGTVAWGHRWHADT